MQVEVRNGLGETVVVNGKKEVEFNVGSFDHRNVRKDVIFQELNQFWSSLPREERNEIFSIYEEIDNTFREVFEPNHLHARLTKLSTKLMSHHTLERVHYWIMSRTRIRPPSSMKLDYDPDDQRDMTYLRADYEEATVMAVALRAMVPVWGQYVDAVSRIAGTNYKEHLALGLISRTEIVNSSPYRRLMRYIEAFVGEDTATTASILGGLGTAEMPDWVMAIALVRRVSTVDITNSDDNDNLIRQIYRSVRSSIETLNRKFKGVVKEKQGDTYDTDEDNTSYAENYKIKQVISDGDLVVLSYYTENLMAMAERLDQTLPETLVAECYQNIPVWEKLVITQPTMTVVQWVIKKALPPRSVPALTKPALIRVFSVVQAALWHWGYKELACLVGSQPIRAEDEGEVLGMMESRSRIPKEMVQHLIELYPYYQQEGKAYSQKQQNPACKAIEKLTKEFINSDWHALTANERLLVEAGVSKTRKMIVPPDMRAQLGSLVILLATTDNKQRKPAIQ